MFKHLLLPTDGSALSQRAAEAGIAFAQALGARVTIYHALEPLPRYIYSEGTVLPASFLAVLEQCARDEAERFVGALAQKAAAAGVHHDAVIDRQEYPHRGILDAAARAGCDAIFMGSHGRSGLVSLLLGSVARKVVSCASIPVTIYRDETIPRD